MKVIIFLLLLGSLVYADTTEQSGSPACPSSLDDNGKPAFITFYGDSLGDFVDMPAYGYLGWDFYLKIHRQEVDWRVQNMAVEGWRQL
jgi:hypothetical protein